MRNSSIIPAIVFLFSGFLQAQELSFPLSSASCRIYQNHIFVSGIRTSEQKATLVIYRLDTALNLTDSLHFAAGRATDQYLQTWSDTLHGFLNIYLQPAEKKKVTIFRFNRQAAPVVRVEDVEAARLNNTAVAGANAICAGKNIYAIQKEPDSSGVQYYLNKYRLKDTLKNFDYSMEWQFPLERKNILAALPVYADDRIVMLFVSIPRAGKNSQWLLRVEALSGKLLKATRLDLKHEALEYQYGSCFFDVRKKEFFLCGTKYGPDQHKLSATLTGPAGSLTIYLAGMDSLGILFLNQDYTIPVRKNTGSGSREPGGFLLRLPELRHGSRSGIFTAEADLYYRPGKEICFYYVNSTHLQFSASAEGYDLEKKSLSDRAEISSFYSTPDKNDRNGRICADSLSQTEQLFYQQLVMPVKIAYREDAEGNPSWLLGRSDSKRKKIVYASVHPAQKAGEASAAVDMNNNPVLIPLSGNRYLRCEQESENVYRIKLHNW